ncbi:unnamed protein product [Closterium sp. NIES-65]|nr:unnamed protein product [Closterium sp. NIES-65]
MDSTGKHWGSNSSDGGGGGGRGNRSHGVAIDRGIEEEGSMLGLAVDWSEEEWGRMERSGRVGMETQGKERGEDRGEFWVRRRVGGVRRAGERVGKEHAVRGRRRAGGRGKDGGVSSKGLQERRRKRGGGRGGGGEGKEGGRVRECEGVMVGEWPGVDGLAAVGALMAVRGRRVREAKRGEGGVAKENERGGDGAAASSSACMPLPPSSCLLLPSHSPFLPPSIVPPSSPLQSPPLPPPFNRPPFLPPSIVPPSSPFNRPPFLPPSIVPPSSPLQSSPLPPPFNRPPFLPPSIVPPSSPLQSSPFLPPSIVPPSSPLQSSPLPPPFNRPPFLPPSIVPPSSPLQSSPLPPPFNRPPSSPLQSSPLPPPFNRPPFLLLPSSFSLPPSPFPFRSLFSIPSLPLITCFAPLSITFSTPLPRPTHPPPSTLTTAHISPSSTSCAEVGPRLSHPPSAPHLTGEQPWTHTRVLLLPSPHPNYHTPFPPFPHLHSSCAVEGPHLSHTPSAPQLGAGIDSHSLVLRMGHHTPPTRLQAYM